MNEKILDYIAENCAAKRGLTVEQLRSRLGGKHYIMSDARAEFAYRGLALGISSPVLGKYLDKDHTAILERAQRWEEKLKGPTAPPGFHLVLLGDRAKLDEQQCRPNPDAWKAPTEAGCLCTPREPFDEKNMAWETWATTDINPDCPIHSRRLKPINHQRPWAFT